MDQHSSRMAAESISFMADTIKNYWCQAASDATRPSVIYRPRLSIDGNQWCALYGDNIQDGLAGFGETPAGAMYDFDVNWTKRVFVASTRATDPLLKEMAEAIHYPQCWDTAAYPALEDALREVYASFKCSECDRSAELLKEMSEALDLAIDIIDMHGIPVGFRGSGIYTAMQKYEEQHETNTK